LALSLFLHFIAGILFNSGELRKRKQDEDILSGK